MAIVFLGLMFWHFGNEGDSWAYLYATVAVWGFNILGRWFWGSSAFKVSEGWLTGCPTTIELCADNVLRIEVLVPNHWTWRAGQHVFLRIPKLNPFDNHPFTIASLPSLGIDSEKFQRGNDNIMVFLTRSYSGGTGRLLNYVKENSDVQLFTFIEGPYGSRLPRFEHLAENVILVAGGVGVSAVLPLFVHISRVMAEPRNTYVTSSLKLIWMVRHASDFGWVHREVQAAIAQVSELQVSVALYITRETKKEAGAEIAGLKNDDKVATTFEDSRSDVSVDGVTIHVSGRPRLGELVPELVGEGRTAVVGCGPEGLKIDLSNAVANLQRRVLKGQSQDVALYTESFDW
jgi:predicted ferric reductase